MSEAQQKREARARVNGELVGRAPRSRVDKTHWNEDIAWLLNESRGELGAQGMSIDPSGGGSRNPADTFPMHKRLRNAVKSVERWRRLRLVWDSLYSDEQRVLTSRYQDQERQHSEIVGLQAAFGDLRGLAWDMGQELGKALALKLLTTRLIHQRRAKVIVKWEARFKWQCLAEVRTGTLDIGDYLALHPADEPALIDAAAQDLRSRLGKFKPGGSDPVIRDLTARVKAANRAAHLAWLDTERRLADRAIDRAQANAELTQENNGPRSPLFRGAM